MSAKPTAAQIKALETKKANEAKKARDAKKAALDMALTQIEKAYGKGAIMKLGERASRGSTSVIPTGCLAIDEALGIGGVPRGRVVEVYGPEASGKTTVALHIIAEAQKLGGLCAFIDAEHALDPTYARALGVDVDELYLSQPDTGEQALEIAEALIRSSAIAVVVIDSVAALVPKAEIDGEMGDSHIGLQARLMSQALRKLTGALNKSDTCAVFINQLREKVGVMFGSPETTSGGRALKFYASIRLDVRRIDILKSGTDMIGSRTRVKVVKNKLAPPFKTAEFDILYGLGISKESALIDMAAEHNIIQKTGSWYSYGDTRIGQGRENARQFMIDNPELYTEVDKIVREILFAPKEPEKAPEEEAAKEAAKDKKAEDIKPEDKDSEEVAEKTEEAVAE